jgi:hypothetical protein
VVDAGVTDGLAQDSGSDAGHDAGGSSDAAVDAGVDPGLVLQECGHVARGELHWPWSRWPAPELLGLDSTNVSVVEADCRILVDFDSDGTVDQRWGYFYDDGLLREIREVSGESAGRTLYDEAGRPWASCRPGSCRLWSYDDANAQAHSVEYDNPPALPTALTREQRDAEGRRSDWTRCTQNDWDCEGSCLRAHARYEEGILRSVDSFNDSSWEQASFDANGVVRESMLDDIDLERASTCRSDGWELSYFNADGQLWETSYVDGPDGRVTSSQTVFEIGRRDPVFSFTTTWTWAADGLSVQLDSVDDGGLWQESHVTWFLPEHLEERDAVGNLTAVHHDDDRDGVYDRTDGYTYEGEGPCREGQAVHMLPTAADGPHLSTAAERDWNSYCAHSPVNGMIEWNVEEADRPPEVP